MPISPRASPIGLPALRASSVASSSCRASSVVGQAVQQRRAIGGSQRAPGRETPRRARSTAASASSAPARGTSAITSAVAGSITRIIRPPTLADLACSTSEPITRLRSVLLGVPEHAEHVVVVGQLDRLRQIVVSGTAA